jgi:hypothetical protein
LIAGAGYCETEVDVDVLDDALPLDDPGWTCN